MRSLLLFLSAAAVTACTSAFALQMNHEAATAGTPHCEARAHLAEWRTARDADAVELARWCRAVGGPVLSAFPHRTGQPPALEQLVTLSWNAHLAEGDLPRLIADLRRGAFTDGRPVDHFVLLIQELYRRGDAVPAFNAGDRSAFAIVARDREAADAEDYAASLGLSFLYVPSMRNGAALHEDRGNAIIATEPLLDPLAIELPLARQRRVALGAAVPVRTRAGIRRLEIINAHLEPLSSPKALWIFTNPRARQVRSLLDLVATERYRSGEVAGIVLGGDFNTVQGGAREDVYRQARAWSTSLVREDPRRTHMMGRLDYLFFKLADGWVARTARVDDRFGSDHHPVVGTISRLPALDSRLLASPVPGS